MDRFTDFLQATGYHFIKVQPLVPMYLHLIVSALFPIYAGAHASLSRPASAAKQRKREKQIDGDDDSDSDSDSSDEERKMEGMSASDAIMLPLLAGITLTGLYFIIKWLDDPAVLNKILNWYFSIFGVLALARLITDSMGTLTAFAFPGLFTSSGKIWAVDSKKRLAVSREDSPETRESPLPGLVSRLQLPNVLKNVVWSTREFLNLKFLVRARVRKLFTARFKVGPLGICGFLIALAAQIYYNLVDKPWWLTNALGFSLAYSALQIMSPTTSWTGTLVLGALFLYDIYFVFFTPIMVTVATSLDIPAKLLFPRPGKPGDDPAKQSFGMLGLGDVVLPGIMIGFALRFDLYLFYWRRMSLMNIETKEYEKDRWHPAKGGWGERFWASKHALVTSERFHGTVFPKPYFHASLVGYVAGLLCTLGIMQVFGHAQPALLYLVPGVLGAIWGTALARGEVKKLWEYTEAEEEEKEKKDREKEREKEKEKKDQDQGGWLSDWKSIFNLSNTKKKLEESAKALTESETENDDQSDSKSKDKKSSKSNQGKDSDKKGKKSASARNLETELIFFSINLPTPTPPTSAHEDSAGPESSDEKPQPPKESKSSKASVDQQSSTGSQAEEERSESEAPVTRLRSKSTRRGRK